MYNIDTSSSVLVVLLYDLASVLLADADIVIQKHILHISVAVLLSQINF